MVCRVAAVVEQSWHRVPGGTATSTIRTLDALRARDDVEVTGLAAWHRRPAPLDVRPTIPVHHIRLPRRVLYDLWHRFERPEVERAVGKVDVVHATGGVVPPAGSASLVVTVHDLAFLHRPGHFTRRGVRFMSRGFEMARRRADIVICPSWASARDCIDHGVHQDRVRVVPWGVSPVDVSASMRDEVRSRYELPEVFVLWVGTAEPRKNLRGLLAAMELTTRAVPLVLVGPDGWGTDLEALMAAASTPVHRIGVVPASVLPVLYDLARVFVYPSLLEGFGMPVLEAMAQATPVVTSASTATEEVVAEAGVVVDPADLAALADAVDRLVSDDDLNRSLGDAGRLRASAFTWEATAEATMAAYRDALGR